MYLYDYSCNVMTRQGGTDKEKVRNEVDDED